MLLEFLKQNNVSCLKERNGKNIVSNYCSKEEMFL